MLRWPLGRIAHLDRIAKARENAAAQRARIDRAIVGSRSENLEVVSAGRPREGADARQVQDRAGAVVEIVRVDVDGLSRIPHTVTRGIRVEPFRDRARAARGPVADPNRIDPPAVVTVDGRQPARARSPSEHDRLSAERRQDHDRFRKHVCRAVRPPGPSLPALERISRADDRAVVVGRAAGILNVLKRTSVNGDLEHASVIEGGLVADAEFGHLLKVQLRFVRVDVDGWRIQPLVADDVGIVDVRRVRRRFRFLRVRHPDGIRPLVVRRDPTRRQRGDRHVVEVLGEERISRNLLRARLRGGANERREHACRREPADPVASDHGDPLFTQFP